MAGVVVAAWLLALPAGSTEAVKPALAAGVPVKTEEAAWKEECAGLRERIGIRLKLELSRALVTARVAADLRLPYPVLPAEKTVAQALAEADARLAREVAEKCPATPSAELRARAEKMLGTPYQPGERVQVRWAEGTRRGAPLGRLGAVRSDRFEIDGGWILSRDVDPGLWQKISPAAHQAAVNDQIARELRIQQNRQVSLEDDLRESVTKQVLLENGYYPLRVPGKRQIKNWISATDILEREMSRRRTALQPALLARIEKEIFAEAGYVFEGNEWIPAGESERRRKAAAAGEPVVAPKTAPPGAAAKNGKVADGAKNQPQA